MKTETKNGRHVTINLPGHEAATLSLLAQFHDLPLVDACRSVLLDFATALQKYQRDYDRLVGAERTSPLIYRGPSAKRRRCCVTP